MYSTKIIPMNNLHCPIEGHGDFIRPTDISYKKYPRNNLKRPTSRPPCKKASRNVIELKNSSVKQIQRTSSYQNLSEIRNKDNRLCKNSKSCENITFIGKEYSIGLRRKPLTKTMRGAEDESHAVTTSAEEDAQIKGTLEKSREEEVLMREALTNFLINAWRNLGKETAKLRKENEFLKKQELELEVVKQQLDDEKEKMAALNIDLMQSRLTGMAALRKVEKFKCTSSQLKREIDELKSHMDAKQIEHENLKNECLELEHHAVFLKKELREERAQKERLQEQGKSLAEKVSSLEWAADEKEGKEAALEEEISKMKRALAAKEWDVERLRTVIRDMEMFLTAKEETIAAVKKVSDAYMMEVTKIRLSGGDASPKSKTAEDNWSSASNVFRTAVFFMLPLMKKLIFP